ncbi:hypothetical protein Terro_4176 [Terriglobus roseus DSM 18391]|uniref:Aspartyl protease n=1 Tax=Terriglobus roseus (strain DSM 18391 / NRRL B-41598 / KBS 63) TaxID=926566 RepID=I3ZMB3_TERRK|nr:hypothetical protein [Terriglobus roseus]AFL90381.1 hypothetical protein Terro_4176 [Terriglobus roseus DSM 18391]
MKRFHSYLAGFAVSLSFLCSVAHAASKPALTVKLIPWRTRWVLPVSVGGAERKLLFDTGGGLTLLSPDALKGCDAWGRLTGFRMFGDRGDTKRCSNIRIGVSDYSVVLPAVGFINLGKLNPGDADLDGIASLNLFDGKPVTIDFLNGQLTVESPESLAERTKGMRHLKARLNREVQGLALSVMLEVPTSKGPAYMELDSGNGGTVLVGKQVAELFGLDPAKEAKQTAHFSVVPGVDVDTEDAFTPDIILDGNLGMPFLKRWVVTLDLKTGDVWVAAAKRPS